MIRTLFLAGCYLALGASPAHADNRALLISSFEPLKPKVRYYWDASNFYVEGDSMPSASLMPNPMVGITSWQQQLPISVGYFGNVTNTEPLTGSLGYGQSNVWKIPMTPVPATTPISLTGNFLRGAVAIAAIGIAIFNPRNNTGQFSQAIGELDQYGGHCGRADDYHYHARGTVASGPQSPYLMNAMHGNVVNFGGQIDPQPTVGSVAPAGSPLAGAVITGFTRPAKDQYALTYTVSGTTYNVAWQENSIAHTVAVQHASPSGTTTGTYTSTARFNYYPMAGPSMLKLPDTGQTLSGTPTFVEDSDYTRNAPSFTDNGNSTITDNVTGLMWTQVPSSAMTWANALTYAEGLSLAGYSDWRLPNVKELQSLVDLPRAIASGATTAPCINRTLFPAATATAHWSSTSVKTGTSTQEWLVDFGVTTTSTPSRNQQGVVSYEPYTSSYTERHDIL